MNQQDQSMDTEEEKIANATAATQRQAQRAAKKLKALGTYEAPLLDRAKEALLLMEVPNLDELMTIIEFKDKLTFDEHKKLKTFLQNSKAKTKKDISTLAVSHLKEKDYNEKIQTYVNQRIDKLHQQILAPNSEEDRAQVILRLIQNNIYDFVEYMDNYPAPSQDFLRILVGLNESLDQVSFSTLFVKVCQKCGTETIVVTATMVDLAMRYLDENEQNQQAAHGLIRLIYANTISLHDFDTDLLLSFSEKYEHAIMRFFNSIGIKDEEIIPLFPPTCFIFTKPMLLALKEGGLILHQRIHSLILPLLIEIVCFSFTEDASSLNTFLEILRSGCSKHSHIFKKSQFTSMLKVLLKNTKEMRKGYFKSLEAASEALRRAFVLLDEKQIDMFDPQTIEKVVFGSDEAYTMMKSRPKIIKQQSERAFQQLLTDLQIINPTIAIGSTVFDSTLNDLSVSIFEAMRISVLLPVQSICYQLCIMQNPPSKWFIKYDTGQGKTALCLGISSFFALLGRIVFIVNASKDLTFRDFKKANSISKELNARCYLIQNPSIAIITEPGIYFATFEVFLSMQESLAAQKSLPQTIIMDEYDSILFENKTTSTVLQTYLSQFPHIIGFSGSNIQDYHNQYLQDAFQAQTLTLSKRETANYEIACLSSMVFNTKRDYLNQIVKICCDQTTLTPVILISDFYSDVIKKALASKGLTIEGLYDKSMTETDSSLSAFTLRQKLKYSVFIISPDQGRGLDFTTSQEIESNGGVHVLISVLPQFYLQFNQFVGRTARIGNKGTYSVCLYDKDQKHAEGEIYLNKKMEQLKNNDILAMSQVRNTQTVEVVQLQNEIKEEVVLKPEQEESKQSVLGTRVMEDETICHDVANDVESLPILKTEGERIQMGDKEELKNNDKNSSQHYSQPNTRRRDAKKDIKAADKTIKQARVQDPQRNEIDALYFKGYSKLSIHKEMLQDSSRVESYKKSVQALSSGKIVIDVGAGTGVLSVFAAESGATHVHSIEASGIYKIAAAQFKNKKLQDKISLHHGMAENVELELTKADVIVSEWMGYFLLYENMLPSVLNIRDRYLSQEGTMIPSHAQIFLAAFTNEKAEFILDPRTNTKENPLTALIEDCDPRWIVSTKCSILDIDLCKQKLENNSFSSKFEVVLTNDTDVSGLVGWFDTKLHEGNILSTSPFEASTHWKQVLFYFLEPIHCQAGAFLRGKIAVAPQDINYRALKIDIDVMQDTPQSLITLNYTMD